MIGNAARFGFPLDDLFWVIKYIDQFNQAYRRTRTTSVLIMLQRLSITNARELAAMTTEACQAFLGKQKNDLPPEFEFVSVLAGELPALTIGDVFHNGRKIGELPASRRKLFLTMDTTDEEQFAAGDTIESPAGSTGGNRILNLWEYSGITDFPSRQVQFSKSRLAVFRRPNGIGGTDIYVVPRMTIFKAFYAAHSVLANAFCSGPWQTAASAALSFNETQGGLVTGVSADGSQWNVVLQTHVPDPFAGILAVLQFDDYGSVCARAIHTKAMEDRRLDRRASWYASAQIPLQVRTGKLELAVKCLQLRSRREQVDGQWREHRKFLVTDISGSSWPAHYPPIGRSRTNDASIGEQTEQTELPKPYRGVPASKDSDENTSVRSDLDANTGLSTTTIVGEQWTWLGRSPQYIQLEKKVSHSYTGTVTPVDRDGTEVSAGTHTSETDALPKAEIKTQIRASNARFEHMVQALGSLVDTSFITNLRVIPARRPEQQGERGGFQCWKFIDDESLLRRRGPGRGFRTIYDRPSDRRSAHWRTALVVAFAYANRQNYWFEIERIRSDKFRSLLVTVDNELDALDLIERTLNIIAEADGVDLKDAVSWSLTGEPVVINAYTHRYTNDGAIRIDLLRKFISSSVPSDS